jgi:sugar phosphate isomerase/epimerase
MLLGLHSDSFKDLGPRRPAWFLDRAAQAGLRGVQFGAEHLPQDDISALYALRAQAEERGLLLEMHGSSMELEPLALMIRTAHALGARVLAIALGTGRPSDPDEFEARLRAAADVLQRAAVRARRYGVWLAIENNRDLTSGELLRFLAAVQDDQVGFCLDTGNPLAVMEDPAVAAELLAPHTLTVHLKDCRVMPTAAGVALVNCPIGQGNVAIARALKAVFNNNPAAHVAIETPTETIEVPCLEGDFLDAFTDRTPQDLAAVLRIARSCSGRDLEALACEERFERSVAAAKQILGEVSLPLEL